MTTAKYNYTKPVIIVVEYELNNMVATSLNVNDEQGDEEEDFSPSSRGDWGDLWN